jgi:FkbM family methyltransferase
MIPPVGWPDFWDVYDRGEWEPWTLEVVGACTGQYADIGAWVGPTVIAAKNASTRIAIEPDPIAQEQLGRNILEARLSGTTIRFEVAIAPSRGTTVMRSACTRGTAYAALGNSETTMMPHGDGESFEVQTYPLEGLADGSDLVKMDIEGAESLVLPAAREWLNGTVPLLVSLHPPWMTADGWNAVVDVLQAYPTLQVDGKTTRSIPFNFCTVLAQ